MKKDTLKRFYEHGYPADDSFEEILSSFLKFGILRIESRADEGWLYPENISIIAKSVRIKSDGTIVANLLRNMILPKFKERNPIVKMLVLWNHAVKYLSRVELDKLSPISEQISDHLIELRDYTFDCFVFSRDNVKTMARKLGLDHLQVAALEHNVAYVIRNWGKWEESVDLFRKVYDKFMTIEGTPQGPYCLITMRNLVDS